MRQLLPHLRQAFDVTRRLRSTGYVAGALEHTLDWLADGVALLRADGHVLHANSALGEFARRRDGLRLVKGAIEIADPEARLRLARAIAGAGGTADANSGAETLADFPASRPSRSPPYIVSVRPLVDRHDKLGAKSGATVIVFVRDPLKPNANAAHLMREIYGFTEAEANLAQAIRIGMPLADYAEARHVSLNTIYTHLRRIKEKADCTRMADLIRKLNDLQVPLRLE
jgi:DNA-binding CsgD family transcriptional regulator